MPSCSSGDFYGEIVGESHHQPNIRKLFASEATADGLIQVTIIPEPRNQHDRNAVAVASVGGLTLGYFSRDVAAVLQGAVIRYRAKTGFLPTCLGRLSDPANESVGIWVDLDLETVGLTALELRSLRFYRPRGHRLPARTSGQSVVARFRTGFSEADATDEADDSYDLGWTTELPEDPVRAIPVLRRLHEEQASPIERH